MTLPIGNQPFQVPDNASTSNPLSGNLNGRAVTQEQGKSLSEKFISAFHLHSIAQSAPSSKVASEALKTVKPILQDLLSATPDELSQNGLEKLGIIQLALGISVVYDQCNDSKNQIELIKELYRLAPSQLAVIKAYIAIICTDLNCTRDDLKTAEKLLKNLQEATPEQLGQIIMTRLDLAKIAFIMSDCYEKKFKDLIEKRKFLTLAYELDSSQPFIQHALIMMFYTTPDYTQDDVVMAKKVLEELHKATPEQLTQIGMTKEHLAKIAIHLSSLYK